MDDEASAVAMLVHADRLHALALASLLEGPAVAVHVICPEAEAEVLLAEQRLEPAVTLFVIEPGGRTAAVDVVGLLGELRAPVLAVVAPDDEWSALRLLDAGAVGYLTTAAQPEDLAKAIDEVLAGTPLLSAQDLVALRARQEVEDARRRDQLGALLSLSEREEEVLADLVGGSTTDVIARDRGIAISTVRTHVRSILRKMGVTSQLEAVGVANRSGWRPPRAAEGSIED